MGDLDTLRILVPESRELDLFAGMLEAEGAVALRCPMVQILALEDTAEALTWIDLALQGGFEDLVLLTGDGLRRLVELSGARKDAFVAALAKMRTIIRGPKPAKALRECGLPPGLAAGEPTSQSVLALLAQEDVSGRRIGVQLYPGEGGAPLVAGLKALGAEVFAVTPYRYASESEAAQVADVIRQLADGRIGMVAFTSSPQIERLYAVAKDYALETELEQGLARTMIASIGPVVDQTLKAHGLAAAVRPENNFHLKPLVRAIIAAWTTR
ncbi:MAG: uroporphyrinogen-III synthase [Rhizomicrobium sp.]|nr:uroporphyrinogen-III synthase [Rhizomicrobium sp.]